MPTKVGFNTYVLWALCFVVVGVCYKLEQNDKPSIKENLPSDVDRVLPSGAFLMSECCSLHQPTAWRFLSYPVCVCAVLPSRGWFHSSEATMMSLMDGIGAPPLQLGFCHKIQVEKYLKGCKLS